MKLKKKIIIAVTSMFLILLIIPFVFINLSQSYEFMGIMILLFFVVNPIAVVIINLIIGKDLKKLWWMPILFCIIFLLSYWLILEEIILDLIIYAICYLVIGIIFMFISKFISVKRK